MLLALKCVERTRQIHSRTPDARAAHIGYHLIGGGRRQFERSIAWQPSVPQRVRRLFFAFATPGYLGSIALGTALLVGTALDYAWRHGWRGASLFAIALLTAVPASELTIQVLQRMISYLIPPRRLPRIELDAVPPGARTMVIVPTILDSVEGAQHMVAHLEVQALGNIDPHVHFAILSDFGDATAETLPRDAAILAAARDGIAALNARMRATVRPFLPVPSRAPVEPARRPLDGMGAQARQDRGIQPAPARRHRHQLRRVGRRTWPRCLRSSTASRSTAIPGFRSAWRAN